MDEKRRARLEAKGIKVQSITPELAAKWGILMSPGQRRGQSKPPIPEGQPNPGNPSSTALPKGTVAGQGWVAGRQHERKGITGKPGEAVIDQRAATQDKKGPVK